MISLIKPHWFLLVGSYHTLNVLSISPVYILYPAFRQFLHVTIFQSAVLCFSKMYTLRPIPAPGPFEIRPHFVWFLSSCSILWIVISIPLIPGLAYFVSFRLLRILTALIALTHVLRPCRCSNWRMVYSCIVHTFSNHLTIYLGSLFNRLTNPSENS